MALLPVIRAYFQLYDAPDGTWVRSTPFTLEVASTPSHWGQGLMGRVGLPYRHGMLFVFPDARRHEFWMANTFIPLDIAWLTANGTVLEIQHLKPLNETPVGNVTPAKCAIEVASGTFAREGIKLGDVLVSHLTSGR